MWSNEAQIWKRDRATSHPSTSQLGEIFSGRGVEVEEVAAGSQNWLALSPFLS